MYLVLRLLCSILWWGGSLRVAFAWIAVGSIRLTSQAQLQCMVLVCEVHIHVRYFVDCRKWKIWLDQMNWRLTPEQIILMRFVYHLHWPSALLEYHEYWHTFTTTLVYTHTHCWSSLMSIVAPIFIRVVYSFCYRTDNSTNIINLIWNYKPFGIRKWMLNTPSRAPEICV